MPMTSSAASTWIPRTPRAERPIGRISCSLKRIAMPALVARTTSRVPSVSVAETRRSPSSSVMARMPARRGRLNSSSGVFLMMPRLVASIR